MTVMQAAAMESLLLRMPLILLACACLSPLPRAAAHDALSPHQRAILAGEASKPDEPSFSFDAPPGQQFNDAEKQAQRERGRGVMPLVSRAFFGGEHGVRIPPGDYRFGPEGNERAAEAFLLDFQDLQRDAANPFVIDATGATFWFDLGEAQMPPGGRCVRFRNCRNVVFRGATIDRGTRGCIEGRITRVDRAGNRFEMETAAGVVVPETYRGGDEQRLLPFKSDGRFCAPLYDLQPGVRKLRYQGITPSGGGRFWVTMLDPDLMARIHDPEWERAYGELGVLRVGDGLSCLSTSAMAIVLQDSANLTVHRVSVYIAKGGPSESGGDGGHLWKDCTFGPRPGTNQWKGADGFLCRSTRHGTTMDNVTIRHAADDVQNFHGVWGKVKAASGTKLILEPNAALRPTLTNARPGDRLRLIHRRTGVLLGEARLLALDGFTVTIDQDATGFAEAQVEWPDHECAGWTVQHCRWEDNFQRLLIMSGPGIVRDCTFVRMGSGISLNTGMGLVGGVPSGITITGSTFIDVNPRPHGAAVHARGHNALGQDGVPPIERLVIADNTFIRSGGPALDLVGIRQGRVERNRFESVGHAAGVVRPAAEPKSDAIVLRHCSGVVLEGNTLDGERLPDDAAGAGVPASD